MRENLYIRFLCAFFIVGCWSQAKAFYFQEQDTAKTDTVGPYEPSKQPTFQPSYRFGDPFSFRSSRSPLFLRDPSQVNMQVQFNPDTTAEDRGVTYSVYENIGTLDFRPATFMTFNEFNRYNNSQLNREYFKERSAGLDGESAVSGRSLIPRLYISPVFDRIFGGSYVDIQPNGFVNLDFGARFQRIDNPAIPLRQQRNGAFNFDQQISMSVVGKVGEKLAITANFDNNNTFDFQNNLKVEYTGYEEDIIKRIEIGNVSMPVTNSLMSGAQSLFGIKTELQFGKLFVTTVLSQQRGRNETISIENGTEGQEFTIQASEYDEDRHFFLGHFFRERYEQWLATVPQISSGVNITRVEVYVINGNNQTQDLRNVVAIQDLGEGSRIFRQGDPGVGNGIPGPTRNEANSIFVNLPSTPVPDNQIPGIFGSTFPTFQNEIDFENKSLAVKLEPNEYTLNNQLGYISLNRTLGPSEMLAVSYEYTFNGQTYKVGELTEDYQTRADNEVIFLKLLRPSRVNTEIPTWDLMMKNVYNFGGFQVAREGFQLRVIYRDDNGQDNPFLLEGNPNVKDIPLIRLLSLDQLNQNNDRQPDGNFDFIEGITINSDNGLIIFPVLEPFGQALESKFNEDEGRLVAEYVYDQLYTEIKALAELESAQNKYFLDGRYSGGRSCTYSLRGINIAPGSVIVTAGGQPLVEGPTGFTVNYDLGQVTIADQICSSGSEILISYEQADLFNFQTRTLTGARFDYRFNDRFNIGATILHLNERPGGISRFAIGNEPTANTKYGFDINYQNDSRLLTKIVDALPLVSTKETSTVTFNAEFAQLLPGTSNIVDGEGTSYIDDFENAITPINIQGWQAWKLGATPRGDYPEWSSTGLDNRYKAAKIAWYTVDNSIFYTGVGNVRPGNISENDLENHYERAVLPQEIFRQRDQNLVNFPEPLFDVAYFPSERGQYNYNPNTLPDGTLPNPEENYGAITRPVSNQTNFENNNIEYIEFWLLDPFLEGENGRILDGRLDQNNTDDEGELVFNLGFVSEDIARDGLHAFENGLSADGVVQDDDLFSPWGRVTSDEPLLNFFENAPGARDNQDIGLDGLSDEDERQYSQFGPVTQFDDPSADNFTYILDQVYDQLDAKIVERYKDWNGMEGNSPFGTTPAGGRNPASTLEPDNENINFELGRDVDTSEDYFEYRLRLENGTNPNGGNLINEFIVDQIEGVDGVNWYQFRIPVRDNPNIVGQGINFQNIRFIRMYLTGWSDPVVMRFAQMRLVGSQWRKVTQSIKEPGLSEVPEDATSEFLVSVVNIEENSTNNSGGTRYVLPPGLNRDIDNTTAANVRFNEQSLQMCIEDLRDKDARAVFKTNLGYDLVNYGRLKMFFHAEPFNNQMLLDDELTGFIRLGTDENLNYYEIEVPLKVTQPGTVEGTLEQIQRIVWPEENEIDVSLNELVGTKAERNRAGIPEDRLYRVPSNDGRYTFSIFGNPDLSTVQVLMIGVRNPGDASNASKSVCVWANEMRVTDFDRNAGWAANARLSTKLADLGTVAANTRYTSIGFGGIQQRISERTRAETTQYNVSANLNLEKFMRPDKTGLVIPMFASIDRTVVTPQFDPLDPDVPLEASIAAIDDPAERERYRRLVQERTTRRSINFTNVRKEKVNPDARQNIYDIENFSFNYAYSDRVTSNSNTATLLNKTVSGGFAYNYSPTIGSIEPFKNSEALSSPYFKLIKDFNFSIFPSNFNFSTNLRRDFTLQQYYNNDLTTEGVEPQYERLFTFVRNYGFRWDFTKNLGLNYNAVANAVIDEPVGIIEGDINTQAEREYIWDQIFSLGRMTNFSQNIQLNYALPLDKIPFTDWISSDARYSVGYGWIAGSIDRGGPPVFDVDGDTIDTYFGNFVNNQRTMGLTARFNMNRLYDKFTPLKNANTPPPQGEKVSAGNSFLRFLMMLQSVNGSYTINESTSLAGIDRSAFILGMDDEFAAPGWGFILGSQDSGIKERAARNGWLVRNDDLTTPFQQTFGTDLDIQAELIPFTDFRVQLSWNRGLNNSYQEIFRFNEISNGFETLTPTRSGSYSTSFLSIRTAFQSDGPNNESDAFGQFERNLLEAREILSSRNPNGDYDTLSQDVLIPSFIAAYSGSDLDNTELTPFPKTPLPNWRVDYTGLINIPALSEIFSSFTISHGYNSTYSVSNFTSSLNYNESIIGLQNNILDYPLADTAGNGQLVPVYIINQVTISEQFVPLIGFNIRTKSNISTRLEFRKSRNLALNMSNAQVTETTNNDITLDFGYSKVGFKLPWRWQGRTLTLENDLTMRVAASLRDSKTVQRRIFDESTVTNGNLTWQVRPTVTYKINNQLDFTFYMERNVTDPRVLSSFKRATTAFGVQLIFGLAQ